MDSNQKYRHRVDLELQDPQFEHLVVELKVAEGSVLVVSLYRPPNIDQSNWIDSYKELINKLKRCNSRIILGMDHNLDLLKFEKHKATQDFLEWNTDQGLMMCVTKPTRITHTSATLIDNIIVSQPIYANHLSHIITEDISDHLPCMVSIPELTTCDKSPIQIKKRKLNEKVYKNIKESLLSHDWSYVMHKSTDTNAAFNELHSVIIKTIDKYAPERTTLAKNKCQSEPWVMPGINKSLKKQRLLYEDLIKSNVATCKSNKYKDYK